jgi:hypothetical protein
MGHPITPPTAHTVKELTMDQSKHLVDISNDLGISPEQCTPSLLAKIADDPTFAEHLLSVKNDDFLKEILLREANSYHMETEKFPNAAALISRASRSLARWAGAGFGKVSEDTYKLRLSTCNSCEHLTTPQGAKGFYKAMGIPEGAKTVCGLCGCDVRKKALLPTEKCPDHSANNGNGRWPNAI